MNPRNIRELINSYISPKEESNERQTIMSIAGIEHLENIWSNIYAYYLDETKSPVLAAVFLRSLERIILKKSGREVNLSGAVIQREVATIKGNRIDLLIEAPEQTIIIENKVCHRLNNDLDDYWLSVNGNDASKTGIILTLSHIQPYNPHYINITHIEWITEVDKEIILNHIILSPEISVLFKDFFQTIKHVSGIMNKYDVNFYLENRVAINQLNQIVVNYRQWLQSLFTDRSFISSLGDFTLVHNDWKGAKERFAMYRMGATDELVITVFYEPLWISAPGKARLCLYLEPLGDWFNKAKTNIPEIRSIANKYGVPSMDKPTNFWHCASVEIPVNEEQLQNEEILKNIISQYIGDPDSELMSAAREIRRLLSQKHFPTYRWRDVVTILQELIPKDNEANNAFWCSNIDFLSFDSVCHIVVVEVTDNIFRRVIEHNYGDEFTCAIKYVYGEDARFSICCRQLMF